MTTKVVSEFQALKEKAATKKVIHDEGFKVGARAFTYTVAMECLDWDLAFLSKELNAEVVVWHD